MNNFDWDAISLVRLLFLIALVAFLFRLPLLGQSFWLDEAAQALESARPWSQQLQIQQDFQPPLLHFITAAAIRVATEEWWLRIWGALIPGVLTVVGSSYLAARLFSKRTAILTGILLATHSFHIFYSQELRPYSLPVIWAVLSWIWLTLDPKQLSSSKYSTWLWIAGLAVINALCLYSSYLYGFLIPAQLLYVFWSKRDALRETIGSIIGTSILFAPMLPLLRQQLAASNLVRESLPLWEQVVSISALRGLALVPAKFLFGVIDVEPTLIILGTTLLLAVGLLYIWWGYWKQHISSLQDLLQLDNRVVLMLCWSVVPLLLMWLFSFYLPVIRPKRLLYILPGMMLSIAALIELSAGRARNIAWLLVALLVGVNLFGTNQYWTQPDLQRENWRALHDRIEANYSEARTIVVFPFDGPYAPWRWYERQSNDQRYKTMSFSGFASPGRDVLTQRLKVVNEYDYVITFDYLSDLSDPNRDVLSVLEEFGYTEQQIWAYPEIGFVRIFAKEQYAHRN